MLRNYHFLQGFKDPEPLPPAIHIEGEEVVTNSDGHVIHKIVRHHVATHIDNTMSASDYDLKILLDSGVQLKPCPPFSSPSLDELSDLNNNLIEEQITEQ